MIVRVAKEDRSRFVILDITAARDHRLSWAAVGVHTYLMTMADGWEVRIPQLLEFRESNGRDALRNIFKELETFGYAELRRKMEGSKIVGSEWVIFEKPCKPYDSPEDGFSGGRDSRQPENQSPDNPSPFKEDQGTKKDQSTYMLISEEPKEKKPDPAETIYAEYPRKVSKPHALKAIRAALKKVGFDELLSSVKSYAATVKAGGTDTKFIPYPATWFTGERWKDNTPNTKHDSDSKPGWLGF